LRDPNSFSLQGSAAMIIPIGNDEKHDLFFKVDPQTRDWRVLASPRPDFLSQLQHAHQLHKIQQLHQQAARMHPVQDSETEFIPYHGPNGKVSPPPTAVSVDPSLQKKIEEKRVSSQKIAQQTAEELQKQQEAIAKAEAEDANLQKIKEKELEETFYYFYRQLLPHFQLKFGHISLDNIFRLIFLRWQTLPMAERSVYQKQMLANYEESYVFSRMQNQNQPRPKEIQPHETQPHETQTQEPETHIYQPQLTNPAEPQSQPQINLTESRRSQTPTPQQQQQPQTHASSPQSQLQIHSRSKTPEIKTQSPIKEYQIKESKSRTPEAKYQTSWKLETPETRSAEILEKQKAQDHSKSQTSKQKSKSRKSQGSDDDFEVVTLEIPRTQSESTSAPKDNIHELKTKVHLLTEENDQLKHQLELVNLQVQSQTEQVAKLQKLVDFLQENAATNEQLIQELRTKVASLENSKVVVLDS